MWGNLLEINYRPIDNWPGEQTKHRERSRFDTLWGVTLELLERELGYLGAKNVVFQIALREEDFRQDGRPRSKARASHPGVILAFDSKYGPLKYATDTFDDFQDNVRAIALGLEALRKVDRYGITKKGEQYTGWKAIPATSSMGIHEAATLLSKFADLGGLTLLGSSVLGDPIATSRAYRAAMRVVHPDQGGLEEEYQQVVEAKKVLDAHHDGGGR